MRKALILIALFGLLATAPVWADEYDEDEGGEEAGGDDEKDVVVLTDKNFESTLKATKFALVEFYAPWCGHCKSLKPHYAKAATELKSISQDVILGKVDATVETETAGKFGIQGYPTLKWFVNGEVAGDYNSGRDADAIVKWVTKKSGPPAVTVSSADALADLEKANPIVVLGFFKALEGDAYTTFVNYAQKTEDVVFAQTTDADVASAAGVAENTVVAIKNFAGEEREVAKLGEELSAESLSAFVLAEKMPLSIEFNQENSGKIFQSGISKQILLWTKAADLESSADVIKAFRAVAKEFKGKLVFVTVNNEGDSAEPVTNFFGLKEAASPSIVGFYMEKNRKFKMTGELTEESLKAFAAGVLDGSIQPDYKSAAVPEEPLEDGVAIIVGKTVDSIVKDKTKDVLLEVYAPWCGHCKKLDPIYKKLAKRFKSVDSVVIAKMDGTENEHPDIDVKGFPSLLFFPAGEDQTPITFEGGDRSLKALTKFIKQHAKVPYELPKKGSDKEEEKKGSDKDEL